MRTISPSALQGDKLRKILLSPPGESSGEEDVSLVTDQYQLSQEIEEQDKALDEALQQESTLHFWDAHDEGHSFGNAVGGAVWLRYCAPPPVTFSDVFLTLSGNKRIQLPQNPEIVFTKIAFTTYESASEIRTFITVPSEGSHSLSGLSEAMWPVLGITVLHQPHSINPTDGQTIARIRELAMYHDGWDGFEGKAPNPRTVQDAEAFAHRLLSAEFAPTYVSLAADGEINFLWSLPSIHLDLGFYGDGTYSYYGRTPAGTEFFADDVPIDTPLPPALLALLTRG
jgi:hypothetical protein